MTEYKEKLEFLRWAISNIPLIEDREYQGVEVTTEHLPKGEEINVVSVRNSIFMGQKPFSITLDFDYPLQKLSYEGGVWMTNSLQEIFQMYEPISECVGHTLIGGLGLGVFSHLNAQYHSGDNVTVEADPRIIELVEPCIDSGYIINDDLFKFVKTMKEREFAYAFFDIWQPTGERVWIDYVVPLRRLCRGKIDNDKIHCWNEEEMRGQLKFNSYKYYFVDPDLVRDWAPNWILAKKGRELNLPLLYKPKSSPSDMFKFEEQVQENTTVELYDLTNTFIRSPGLEEWEKQFGDLWDQFHENKKGK